MQMQTQIDLKRIAKRLVAPLALLLPCSSALAAYANLEITLVEQEILGTTAVITGSGSKDNTASWDFNDSARFILTGDDGTAAMDLVTYGLDVRPISTTGGFQPDTDSLMIARTVNSQGLTDTGSLSLYISPDGAGIWTGEFRFSLYQGSGGSSDFSTPASPNIQVTSLDLDFDQRMELRRNELSAYGLNDPTDIVVTDAAGGLIDFQGDGNATFSDPEAAVIGRYDGRSDFNVAFSHDDVALFMFEFRNPPSDIDDETIVFFNVPVPPPFALLLPALGGFLLLRARNRKH